ncbi:hypothetical protein KUTeg_018870 [Tegillarca granosa]|uniref:Importin N-terminal domain-containing protein n=1 Tax=Tegillarca granosa TaxID=220873 RepID=A0ABQ9ED14_TEGGR|nr:hypothetical protein KUTeg_018870 [Tegillarca granosa]
MCDEMAQQLEETLGKLLVPDNNTIQAATQQLKELFKDPNIIPGLCQVLSTSQTPQVRQYAAVLLRRKIQKSRHWRALPENICSKKSVRNAVAQVAATVAKHDLPNNQWPQLFQFLLAYTKTAAAEQLKPHLVSLLQLLAEVINDTENKLVPYYAIRTMTELIFYIGDDEMKYIQGVIPRILQVVKELITIDEDQACEALEVFDEMLECEVAIIVPHIKPVMDFCLEIIPNENLGDSVRVKAMSFIASLVKLKKKAFLKHKLVNPVLHTIFTVMCSESDDDGIDEEEDENESQTPTRFAPQMSIVESAIVSDKPSQRRASYIGLAVVAEGCADYITNKHLQAILQCVVKGLNDPDHTPDIRKDILPYMPALMEHLLNVLKTPTSNRMKELAISAIGAAANAAKDGIKPYFQEIIDQFKDTLGVLARTVGEDTFLPLAKECAQLGINLLQSVDDPDLRRCVYGLFAALSSLLKSDTGPYLEVLVTHMMGSLQSTEGVKAHFKEAEETVSVFNEEDFCDEEDLTGEEEDDEEENKIEGISVENAFLDEKEDTCCALGEIAGNTGPVFFSISGAEFSGSKMITAVIPKLIDIIKEDKDRMVVMTAIDTISDMLEKIGLPVIQTQGYADAILTKMKEIFTHKLPCQDQDTEEEDEEQAEFDGMLIESAGDTLPKKESSAVSERSFAVGTLAEIIEACGWPCAVPFVEKLYPLFMKMIHDSDEEVRSNSLFALEILKCLFDILNKESNVRVLDNICAATCRMIMANKAGVPMEHAFLKHKLVNPVLHTIFTVMCSESDDDGIDEEEDENESQTPTRFAPQMSIVESAIVSDKPSQRRASYIGLAVVAEGCADYITNKHLQAILQCVVKGLNDPDHTPDISKFASELLPLLFQYLGRATQEAEKNPRGLTKSYYALEMKGHSTIYASFDGTFIKCVEDTHIK